MRANAAADLRALRRSADMEIKAALGEGAAGTAATAGGDPGYRQSSSSSSSSRQDGAHLASSTSSTEEHSKAHKGHKKKTPAQIVTSLVSGGIAGACAKTTIAPLERVKIMFQVTHQPFSVTDAFRTVGRIYRQEGLLPLWKGNGAVLARIIPFAAIQFMSHEQYSGLLASKDGQLTGPARFISGALAGATATTMVYPLDLMRARLAMHKHPGLVEGLTSTYGQGFRTLYRGLGPTLAGIVPYAGTSFFTYEMLQKMYRSRTGQEVNVYERLVCGAIGGLCGQTIAYPLDIVRRRMQTDEYGNLRKYYNVPQTMRMILRNEGWRALYKGLSLNWIKGPVAVGISFTTYDLVSKRIRTWVPQ